MKSRSARHWLATLATVATLGAVAVSVPITAAATGVNFTVNPWVYGCGHTQNGGGTVTDTPGSKGCPSGDVSGTATSTLTSGSLLLQKTGPTTNDLAAGATIGNTGAGINLTQLDFDIAGACTLGSPRWNIETADGKTHFYGCLANNVSGHVTITSAVLLNGDGSTNGGIKSTDRVTALDLVADESGSSTLTNIVVTGTLVAPVLTNGPEASSWAKGRLDVFIRGSDNALWHKFYSSATGWSGWSSLGAPAGVTLASDPVAVSWGVNRIDVFVRGSDNALWHTFYDIKAGGWNGWFNHGGILSSGPAATSWGVGRLDVFYRLTDNTLGHIFYTSSAGWSTEFSHGGLLASDPGAISWGVGRIDVFARGSTDTLIHNDYDQAAGGWLASWATIAGDTITSGPTATTWGVGRLDVFAKGTDNALHHTYYASGIWQGWTTQANPTADSLTSDPGGAAWASGRIDVFARGMTNNLLHKYYDVTAGGWSAWDSTTLSPNPG